MLAKECWLVAASLLLGGCTLVGGSDEAPVLTDLADTDRPLQVAFDDTFGRTRLLLVLAPT